MLASSSHSVSFASEGCPKYNYEAPLEEHQSPTDCEDDQILLMSNGEENFQITLK